MAMMPNWLDKKYEKAMERATAEECLEQLAKDDQIVQAVKDALTTHDANAKKPGWAGPTRTQTIRKALADVLQAP
jgi:hypothetical protein